MIGYPKGDLTKQDFDNLLSMPKFAEKAKVDLERLAAVDDSKVVMEIGTAKKSISKQIDNPFPAWKRAGFESKKAIDQAIQDIKPTPIDDVPIDPEPIDDVVPKIYKRRAR